MAKPLVNDASWQEIKPLLPSRRCVRVMAGRASWTVPVPTGIVFVLRVGTPWELLPPGVRL